MDAKSLGDHQKLLTEVIKKQIVILGPDITLAKARNVAGLTIADDGTVTAINGDPQLLTQKLVDQFMELSGLIVKKTMEPLLASSVEEKAPLAATVMPSMTPAGQSPLGGATPPAPTNLPTETPLANDNKTVQQSEKA